MTFRLSPAQNMFAAPRVLLRESRRAARSLCTDEIPGLRRNSFAKHLPRRSGAGDPAPFTKPLVPKGPLVRVSTAVIRPSSADELAAVYNKEIPALYEGTAGFQGAYLLVNRGANTAQSITLWTSHSDFEAAAARPEYAQAMQQLGGFFLKHPDLAVWEHAASFCPGEAAATSE